MTRAQDPPKGPSTVAERRISDKAFLGHYAASLAAGILIAAGSFMILPWLLPAAALPWLGVFCCARLARIGNKYRLYPDRLEIESGVLTRKIENVDLFRVRDVGLRQGLVGRCANFGDVYLHSTDSSTPDLHLRAIEAPREFYDQLRELVSASRAQNRTLIVEEGQTLPEP